MRARVLMASVALSLSPMAAGVAGSAASAAAPPSCDGHPATIVGTSGADDLTGTPGDDVIAGLGGDDTIHGLGGSDVICGDRGEDHLLGGPGADRLLGGKDGLEDWCDDGCFALFGDTLEGGPGRDYLDPGFQPGRHLNGIDDDGRSYDRISYADSSAGVHLDLPHRTATGEGHDTFPRTIADHPLLILGSAYDDVIVATKRGDTIDPGAGDDRVRSGGGADAIRETSDSGSDHYRTGAGWDLVELADGHDEVDTGPGHDHVHVPDAGPGSSAQVSTGAGRDDVYTAGLGSSYSYAGDGGPLDTIYLTATGPDPSTLRPERGRVTRSGETTQASGFAVWRYHSDGPVTAIGGPRTDRLVVDAPELTADLRAGNDSLDDRADHADIQLGNGQDHLVAPLHGAMHASLGRGDDLMTGDDDGPPYGDKVVKAGAGHDRTTATGYGFTCSGFEQGRCRGAFTMPTCDGKTATMASSYSGEETLDGTDGPDVIVALGRGVTIHGNGGDDTVCGDSGGTLDGGPGDDTIKGKDTDTVSGGPGADDLSVGRSGELTYLDAPDPVTVDVPGGTASGDGSDSVAVHDFVTIVGSAFGDHIVGGPEADTIQAMQGDDTVEAGDGRDQVVDGVGNGLDSGDDLYDLGRGADTADVSSGSDTLNGGAGDDTAYVRDNAPRGPVTVAGMEFTSLDSLVDGDSVSGGQASWQVAATQPTTVDLAAGTVTTGDRTAHVTAATQLALYDLRDTTITGSTGPDDVIVSGTERTDTLEADLLGGNDRLGGDFGAGTVQLGDGDDVLTGRFHGMQLDGGPGTDTLSLTSGGGNTCTGFENGTCNP